jgi:hypothetical protein
VFRYTIFPTRDEDLAGKQDLREAITCEVPDNIRIVHEANVSHASLHP